RVGDLKPLMVQSMHFWSVTRQLVQFRTIVLLRFALSPAPFHRPTPPHRPTLIASPFEQTQNVLRNETAKPRLAPVAKPIATESPDASLAQPPRRVTIPRS